MIAYIPMFLPAAWAFDAWGLRVGVTVGTGLNALGTWVRWEGRNPDGFVWALVGQTLAAVAQPFLLACPSLLASMWFPAHERSVYASIHSIYLRFLDCISFSCSSLSFPDSMFYRRNGRYLTNPLYFSSLIFTR